MQPEAAGDSKATAIEVFAAWTEAKDRAQAPGFEDLLRLHPALEPELLELHEIWKFLADAGELSATPDAGSDAPSEPASGTPIRAAASGRYRIEDEVARGGMGAILRVYDHDLGRHLAMKVILGHGIPSVRRDGGRRGPDTLARFLEEARVTGRLEHPGIVPVHELGHDEQGRVYFTMKLVQGRDLKAIFELVRERREGWSEVKALGVLLKVCEALSYAHAKGVIHRDLKPANVMVGSFGEVYVMDWGLAKVIGATDLKDLRVRADEAAPEDAGEGSDSPLYTIDGDVIGTPSYMPPEQAAGLLAAMGPHSDVYAVGAMLYHLLAGHAPYVRPGEKVNTLRIWRSVIEGPPVALESLAPRVSPELVAICERAMAREIAERYRDIGALAADLSSYLEGRVVAAYEQGTWAETKKWIRRNRALAASLAAAVLLLAAGLVSSLLFTRELQAANATIEQRGTELASALEVAEESARVAEARRRDADAAKVEALAQRAAAERSAEETKLVADFQSRMLFDLSVDEFGRRFVVELEKDLAENLERIGKRPEEIEAARAELEHLLKPVNPTNVAQAVLQANLFEPAINVVETEYAGKPLLAAALLTPLADTLKQLSLVTIGERAARAAVEARTAALGSDHPDTLSSMYSLASVLLARRELSEAEQLFRAVLAGRRAKLGDRDASTLRAQNSLALVRLGQEQPAEAEALLREAIAGKRATLGDRSDDTLTAINNLGLVYSRQGRFAEAEAAYREALEGQRVVLGDQHPSTLRSINNLASVCLNQGKLPEAEALYREAWAGQRAKFGDEHPATLIAMNGLARILNVQKRHEEAEAIYRKTLEIYSAKFGDDHPSTLSAINNVLVTMQDRGRHAEAEPLCRDVLARRRATLGDRHPDTLRSISNLAGDLHAMKRSAEAEPLLREALAGFREALGDEHPQTLAAEHDLAIVLLGLGDLAGADALFREALAGQRAKLGDAHPATRQTCQDWLVLQRRWHRLEPEAGHDRQVEELERLLAQ